MTIATRKIGKKEKIISEKIVELYRLTSHSDLPMQVSHSQSKMIDYIERGLAAKTIGKKKAIEMLDDAIDYVASQIPPPLPPDPYGSNFPRGWKVTK